MRPITKEVKELLKDKSKDMRIWVIMILALTLLILVTRFPV